MGGLPLTGAVRGTLTVMSWIVWLSIPPLATALAVMWTVWSNRPRRPAEPVDSVAAYEQFRTAISRKLPPAGPPGRDRDADPTGRAG